MKLNSQENWRTNPLARIIIKEDKKQADFP